MNELTIALKAVQLYKSLPVRHHHVTQKNAAKLLGLSVPTVSKIISSGKLKLNQCGMIPIHQVDLYLEKTAKVADKKLVVEETLLDLVDLIKKDNGKNMICGVYFLIHEENIVYVGQSANVHSRIIQHRNNKTFDRFTYIECEKKELNILESKYIKKFKPTYNVRSNNYAITQH